MSSISIFSPLHCPSPSSFMARARMLVASFSREITFCLYLLFFQWDTLGTIIISIYHVASTVGTRKVLETDQTTRVDFGNETVFHVGMNHGLEDLKYYSGLFFILQRELSGTDVVVGGIGGDKRTFDRTLGNADAASGTKASMTLWTFLVRFEQFLSLGNGKGRSWDRQEVNSTSAIVSHIWQWQNMLNTGWESFPYLYSKRMAPQLHPPAKI
eukprot:CAMPEP_0178751740 /NCGR_PEP_ID=MMETSP0744-20121128/10685_1 /TAXON_ID=913974 /ORGANISM="Nitzschia punctata, Strain CCMP561" /LENGTH=212 /DNA_ID=CAMNT_0020405401 /DNA_START=523 /DNA_END=1161 /DNA_ORIENTATION=-